MIIAQVVRSRVPPEKYGGTERDVYWLGQALAELGHRVFLLASPGSRPAGAELIPIPPRIKSPEEILRLVPRETEIVHFHFPLESEPRRPYLVTVHGNMGREEKIIPNTVFLSRDHARRHGSRHYVFNGVDLRDYEFSREKDDYFLFMARFLFRKGRDRAVRLARELDLELVVAGGWRPSFRRNIRYVGEVGGEKKRKLLSRARALLLPVRWPEPLGLVAIEALASGTPVIASRVGALPEVVSPEAGFLCDSDSEYIRALNRVKGIDPGKCRERAERIFSAEGMARNYLRYYERVIKTGDLGEEPLVEY